MRSNGGRTLAALSQMGARVSCQTENGAVTSVVLVQLRVEIGPLRLALAGATRSGWAGVGSGGLRSAGEATPHPSGVNRKLETYR